MKQDRFDELVEEYLYQGYTQGEAESMAQMDEHEHVEGRKQLNEDMYRDDS